MLVAVLAPEPGQPGFRPSFFTVVPLTAGGWVDVAANLALYLPLGLLLARRGVAPWRVWLIGATFSALAEFLQSLVPGRDPSVTDLLANTCGASLGSAIAATPLGLGVHHGLLQVEAAASRLLHAPPRLASRCSLAWAGLAAAVLVATAFLLSFAPPAGRYYVRSPLLDPISGPVRIGGGGDDNSYFRGLIDDVRIYDRARPAEAIQDDMAQPVRPATAPPAGLIAAYSFDARSGSVARDETVRGHDGQVAGASWVNRGRHGGALSFDGSSSRVIVPAAPDLRLSAGMTLEAWILPVGEPSRWPPIVEHDSYHLYASSPEGRYLAAGGGRLGRSNERVHAVEPILEGKWTHLAATYDGRTLRVYIDGRTAGTDRWWSNHQPANVSLDGRELPLGAFVDRDDVSRSLAGSLTMRATVTCGTPEPAATPVFLLMASRSVSVLNLLSEGDDLLLRPSTRARRIGLSSPDYRVPGVFSQCARGQQVGVQVIGPFQNARAEIDGRTVEVAGLGLGSAWALLIHSALLPAWLRTACTIAWLGLLAAPFGYWMRPTLATTLGAAVLLLTFWFIPRVWPVQPIDGIQLAAVCSGVLVGAMGQARVRPRTA